MKQQVNTKGYGSLKKVKGVGLAGVLTLFAGVAVAGAQTAYGDEVVAPAAGSDSATFSLTAAAETPAAEASVAEVAADQAVATTAATADQAIATTAATETPAVAKEAVQVANTTTATVSHDSTTTNESRASIEISTSVDAPVKEGQVIEYTLTNLPTGGLNGADVKIADGTVVGKIEVVGKATVFSEEQNNALANDSEHDKKLSAESMDSQVTFRVVFNKAAEEVQDLSYKFGYSNQFFSHFISTMEYAYVSKITMGDDVIAQDTVNVEAYEKTPIKSTTVGIQSPYNQVTSSENGLKLTNGQLQIGLYNSASQPIEEGSTITLKMDGTALVTLTNKVGDVIVENSQRGYYDDSVVNEHGIILNDLEQAVFEVVSNDGETIVLKSLTTIEKTNKFGLKLSAIYTPSSDEISEDGKKITGINNSQLTIKDASGKVVYETERDNDYANIYGNSITAEAAFTGKVVVRHVTTDGEVLKEESPVAGKEGESYETFRSDFEGYNYVKSSDNTSGKFTRGTIEVTYTYEKKTPTTTPDTTPDPYTPPKEDKPNIPVTPDKPKDPSWCIPVTYSCITYVPVTYVSYYCPPTYYYVSAGCYPSYSSSYSYSSRSSYSLSYSSYSYSSYSLRTSYSRSYNYASCFGYSAASYPSCSYQVSCW